MSNQPDWDDLRSAVAGVLVGTAVVAGSRYGPEAGAAAGTLMEQAVLPIASGALLGVGTFIRRRVWGWLS